VDVGCVPRIGDIQHALIGRESEPVRVFEIGDVLVAGEKGPVMSRLPHNELAFGYGVCRCRSSAADRISRRLERKDF
jgi:hypothetical protein